MKTVRRMTIAVGTLLSAVSCAGAREAVVSLHGATATVIAATAIHVTARGGPPLHVALLEAEGRRLFAKLDPASTEEIPSEQELAGQKVRVQISSDGDQTFQLGVRQSSGFGRFVDSLRRRVGGGGGT